MYQKIETIRAVMTNGLTSLTIYGVPSLLTSTELSYQNVLVAVFDKIDSSTFEFLVSLVYGKLVSSLV